MNRSNNRNRDSRPQRKYSDNSNSEDNGSIEQEVQNKKRGGKRDSYSSGSDSRGNSKSRSRSRSNSRSASRSEERNNRRGPPARREGEECSELFVRNLPWKADEKVIADYFSKFGEVSNVKILYNRETGKPKGIGFVEFASRSDAENAISNADDLELDGRKLEVSFSNQKEQNNNNRGRDAGNRDRERGNRDFKRRDNSGNESNTVFVGNLGFKTSEDTIRSLFEDCGSIQDIRIAKTPEGKSKGFCHVEFESNDAASRAMKKNGENIDGRDIRIDYSSPRQAGGNFNRGDRGFGGRGGNFRGGNSNLKLFFIIPQILFFFKFFD